jgi:DNA-directed RNA polymerase specialized sigma24 family protein
MELLEPEDRKILALRHWDNQSFPEIGERLGIPSNTARMRNNRAIVRLTEKILVLKTGKLDQVL